MKFYVLLSGKFTKLNSRTTNDIWHIFPQKMHICHHKKQKQMFDKQIDTVSYGDGFTTVHLKVI